MRGKAARRAEAERETAAAHLLLGMTVPAMRAFLAAYLRTAETLNCPGYHKWRDDAAGLREREAAGWTTDNTMPLVGAGLATAPA